MRCGTGGAGRRGLIRLRGERCGLLAQGPPGVWPGPELWGGGVSPILALDSVDRDDYGDYT